LSVVGIQYPATSVNANFYRLLVPGCKICLIKMSLSRIRLLAGRELESEVWQYFIYDDKTNKSSCLVKVGSDVNTKPCGLQLVRRNPTNLKVNNIILNNYD